MTDEQQQHLRTLKLILFIAMGAVAVAALSGLLLLAIDTPPNEDTTAEAILGITATFSGFLSGVLVISAMIYAQVKNLWRLAPMWFRVVVGIFAAVAIGTTLWNWTQQLFAD